MEIPLLRSLTKSKNKSKSMLLTLLFVLLFTKSATSEISPFQIQSLSRKIACITLFLLYLMNSSSGPASASAPSKSSSGTSSSAVDHHIVCGLVHHTAAYIAFSSNTAKYTVNAFFKALFASNVLDSNCSIPSLELLAFSTPNSCAIGSKK